MFRTFKNRAGVLSLSRLPLRVHSGAHQNALSIERVRFMRPLFRPRAILSSVIKFGIGYIIFTTLVLSPLDRLAEEPDEEALEAQDDSTFFIPFPGTTREVQPPPYRGSDPEWQEYIKFSKDPALGKQVRDELAIFIKQIVEKHPVLTLRCGKDIKLRRYWLDVDFPPLPPPEFERSGIEITEDHIAWTKMPVDSLTVFRIRQALWPSALTQSLWSFSKVLIKQDTATIAGILGIHSKPQPSFESILSQRTKESINEPDKPEQSVEGTSPTTPAARDLGETRADPSRALNETSPDPFKELAKVIKTEAQSNREAKNDALSPLKVHLLRAATAFKTKFEQTWRPAPSYPPRGSILVSGLIELDSPKAWLVMDVKAAWDPKTKSFDTKSMQVVMRRLQMKKQAPLSVR